MATRSRNVTPYRAPRHETHLDVIDLLIRVLRPTIALPGAACAGLADLFDPDASEAHHTRARQVCATCPARQACLEWSTAREGSVSGILSGILRTGPRLTKPKKRPVSA